MNENNDDLNRRMLAEEDSETTEYVITKTSHN
jgi:hypothetical protein